MKKILDYIGYHKKWHGKVQNWRKPIQFSVNELLIKHIFDIINIKRGNFVEFGAWDGIKNANTRTLFLNGWRGLYIESDETRFKELKNNFEKEKRIYISNTFIDDDNQLLDSIIGETINDKIDFMSIDIDGLDVEIFKSINKFLPLVVCIEGGQILEPYHRLVTKEISAKNVQQSLNEMKIIFEKKGYTLLCSYQDSFFIKNKFADKFKINNDIFDLYIEGLIAFPRIPYIKRLLEDSKLQNRIIDYIIKDIDKSAFERLVRNGNSIDKSVWVDENYNHIRNKLFELKILRESYPYDKYNEALWQKISIN